MTKTVKAIIILVAWLSVGQVTLAHTLAQASVVKLTISFESFTAVYHLSKDAQNHSLLTTEETILADFADNSNLYGITRTIPTTYQGHSVSVKILTVTDKAGSPVPYKTSTDKSGNLVVVTGDPAITIFGLQTLNITYQTRDVVDLKSSTDQLLLDVNGRSWDQSLGSVSAVLYVPKSLATSLAAKPSCYIGYQNQITSDCSISNQTINNQTVITAKSTGLVAAQHALVVKTSFKPATFAQPAKNSYLAWVILVIAAAIGALLSVRWLARRPK